MSDAVINLLAALFFWAAGVTLFVLAVVHVGFLWPFLVIVGAWLTQCKFRITRN